MYSCRGEWILSKIVGLRTSKRMSLTFSHVLCVHVFEHTTWQCRSTVLLCSSAGDFTLKLISYYPWDNKRSPDWNRPMKVEDSYQVFMNNRSQYSGMYAICTHVHLHHAFITNIYQICNISRDINIIAFLPDRSCILRAISTKPSAGTQPRLLLCSITKLHSTLAPTVRPIKERDSKWYWNCIGLHRFYIHRFYI